MKYKVGNLVSLHGFLGIIVDISSNQRGHLIAKIEWIGDGEVYEHYVHYYEYCESLKLESI
jgi:hypothetical protein